MIHGDRRPRSSIGAPGEIRTPGPQVRSLVLYPTELRARKGAYYLEGVMDRQPSAQQDMDDTQPDEKQFHGWRLLGVLGIVIGALALVSAIIDWLVVR